MSIQPLSISPPAVEPAIQRRRAAERDAGAERESFVLPREEAAPEVAAPAREIARERGRDAGEDRRAADEPAAPSEKASEAAAKPAGEETGSETDAKAPAHETTKPAGRPAGTVAASAPVAQPPAPNTDIGALVSIAVAEQAESQPAKPGKGAAPTGEALEEKKAEGEVGAAGAEPKADGVAVVAPPAAQAVAFVQPVPVPTMPAEPAAPVADPEGEGDLLSGKAKVATATVALSMASTLETMPGAASDAAGAVAAATGGIPPAAPKHRSSASVSEPPSPSVDGGQMATPEATQAGAEKAAGIQAQTQTTATGQGSTPAEFKPVEAIQQALNPIDLSAMGQQGGARPEPLRVLTTPEQIAAQASVNTTSHQASEGQPTPLHVLPIEIGLRALAGARQFDIRLDPGELGRVDVNLSISDTGEVSAKMVVDRVETLHLLQRDARTLERAFEQAGLKPSDAGVDITLRDPSDQSGFRQNRHQDEAPQRGRVFANGSEIADDQPISTQSAPVRRFVRLGGVDVSV